MGIYNSVQQTAQFDLSGVRPALRKSGRDVAKDGFSKELTQAASATRAARPSTRAGSLDELTAAQKDVLLEKLHNGRGDLSKDEWDGFLLDLVDLGLITDIERLHTSGKFLALPDPDKNGQVKFHTPVREVFTDWPGDPLAWLDKMNLLLTQECKYAELEGRGNLGLFRQKDACAKVAQLVRALLG